MTELAKQYFVASPLRKKPSPLTRLRVFFWCFAFAVLLRWVMGRFLFHEHYHRGELETWLEIFLLPTVLSLTYALRFHTMFGWNSLLTLSEDSIEKIMYTRYGAIKKRIERHRVRSVSEMSQIRFGIRTKGLAVRDREGFASWFSGYVFVPDTIDDYDVVKAKLLSWAPPTP